MTSGTSTTDQAAVAAAGVLASARSAKATSHAAEARVLADAVAWAHLHPADTDDVATYVSERGEETGIPIAGPGAPLVAEFCVAEFATALGLTEGSGRNLLGQALELAHRLPRVWARVQAGELAPWRARRIAEHTITLTFEAAAWVDAQVAPFAHRLGPVATERLVDEAIARFMPEHAQERRDRAADGRHFDIDHDHVTFAGTSRVHGELDLADALDLNKAVAAGAEDLKRLGSAESLDARRAAAVGVMARRDLTLDYGAGDDTADPAADAGVRRVGLASPRPAGPARVVNLFVHLSDTVITGAGTGGGGSAKLARVENGGGHLLTAEQVRTWCGTEGTKVIVRPVIDLNDRLHATSYEIPDRIREAVILRDRTCIFPWCTRPARRCDLDHGIPWEAGGQTCTDNLAPLCRKHHRLKTHGGWSYRVLEPGTYEWTSPFGYTYRRDAGSLGGGTTDLTPPPVPGPIQPADRQPDQPPDQRPDE